MTRKIPICFLLILFSFSTAQATDSFPQPPELQRDVDFWVSIFTEYKSTQGVMHDASNLGIVYQIIDFPADIGRRERRRQIVRHRKKIQAVLSRLSSGKRDNLDAEAARILALWPEGVANKTLVDASRNIRHQQGLNDRFRDGLIRAGRWRSYIEQEFTALGVPVELAALPHVESSYDPGARSHVGASGIWQFTRSTGRRFLRIDHIVDERNDPFAATRAAGKLLAYNYSITGNWPMAITAYNHGLAGARRAMRQFGDTAYADIMRKYKGRTFGFASRNFYVAFLAAKHVDQNAEQYFPGLTIDAPTAYAQTALTSFISVADLSAALGVTSRQLAQHNLSLQSTVWQGSKNLPRGFEVRMPLHLLDGSIDELLGNIAADQWQSSQLPDLFHTIRRGDTLSQIAETYKTRVSTLVALNNLGSSHRIRAGQRLRLPAAGPAAVDRQAGQSQATLTPSVTVAAAVPESQMAQGQATLTPPVTVAAAVPESQTAQGQATLTPPVTVAAAVPESQTAQSPGALTPAATQTALLSDPSDYGVAGDNTIEIHPLETLGHFADWLEIRTQRLRDINGLAFRTPVEVGKRIRLDLGKVDAKAFEDRRIAWHRAQQDSFFRKNIIAGVAEHVIVPGESIWILALRKYNVPMWLFRQYNPEVDLDKVRPGTQVHFPVLKAADTS